MAEVLIDTSAWVDFFRHPLSRAAETVDRLLRDDLACTTGVVTAELLRGTRTSRERNVLLAKLSALSCLQTTQAIWVTAGDLAATLDQQGITLPLTDILIAAVAQANGCPLYTVDAHFSRIPHITLYRPS